MNSGFFDSVQEWIDAGMPENKIICADNRKGLPQLPEKCANLIVADPPYFECKGEFDFIWKSFDEYLEFMEGQARLYKPVLADNGTLFVYGHAKRIAYVQVIFDKYFQIENNITWKKIDSLMYEKGGSGFRCFLPNNERILMYSNEIEMTGLEFIKMEYGKTISPFSKIMINKMKELNLSQSDISVLELSRNGNKTGWVHNKLSGEQLPTKIQWSKICSLFGIKDDYENLCYDYETLRRPFNNVMRLSDVMEFSQEAHITGQYDHETQKPEKLTRALILTCSRENDLVVVPFVGSGTECAMAVRENRRFIGFETNPKHCETATARVRMEFETRRQEDMFAPKSNGKAETIDLF